jgi:hypothetical protein
MENDDFNNLAEMAEAGKRQLRPALRHIEAEFSTKDFYGFHRTQYYTSFGALSVLK